MAQLLFIIYSVVYIRLIMSQNHKLPSTPTKPETHYFQILLKTLTANANSPPPELLFNVSIGRQVFQTTKLIHGNWTHANALQLNSLRLNFVVLSYSPERTQEFVIRLCLPSSKDGQSIAESPIDCNCFIDHFQQSGNGAFKHLFHMGDGFTLQTEVFVERNRYAVEKLVKTVKNSQKGNQKSILQNIAGRSSLLNTVEKPIVKQNRFKRGSPGQRRSSNQRFARSKTPKRLGLTPKKQERTSGKIEQPPDSPQVSDMKNSQEINAEEEAEEKVNSKRVYTSRENNQAKQPIIVAEEAEEVKTAHIQQPIAKVEQPPLNNSQEIKPIATFQQVTSEEIPLSSPILDIRSDSIGSEEIQNTTDNVVQDKVQTNQLVKSQQNPVMPSLESQEKPNPASDQHRTISENQIHQIQQIELAGRLPFREQGAETQAINIRLQQVPIIEQIGPGVELNRGSDDGEMPANGLEKDYILINEQSPQQPKNQAKEQNTERQNNLGEIVISEQKETAGQPERQTIARSQPIEQCKQPIEGQSQSITQLYPLPIPEYQHSIQEIAAERQQQYEIPVQSNNSASHQVQQPEQMTSPIVLQPTATISNQKTLPPATLKSAKPQNTQDSKQLELLDKESAAYTKPQTSLRYMIAMCVILVMIIVQNAMFQYSDEAAAPANPEEATEEAMETKKMKQYRQAGKKTRKGRKSK